eukprot:12400784-Alexandrium_andersonii.AAC.1
MQPALAAPRAGVAACRRRGFRQQLCIERLSYSLSGLVCGISLHATSPMRMEPVDRDDRSRYAGSHSRVN